MTTADGKLVDGVSVVIPVYNSAEILPELAARLGKILPALTLPYEVLLVNDGSRDESWRVITALAARFPWIHGINMLRNFGQHNALLCGIRQARYTMTVTMDDDLQHPPEQIGKLLAKLEDGVDVVYGTPEHEQHGLWRDYASQITKLALCSAMGAATARHVSAFRAFRTDIRTAFADYRSPNVALDVLLTWGATRFATAPVRHDARHSGASNYSFRKLLAHAMTMMTGYSTLPLRFASLLGFVLTLFGAIVLGYVLVNYLLHGGQVPGFTFLASLISIFSGAQLFSLGIIGEYLARMHYRMMERPTYVVREETQAATPAPR